MTNIVLYTNVLLQLLLPKVSDFAAGVGLPESHCSITNVRTFSRIDSHLPEGVITFDTGNKYWFLFGYVQKFESPNAFFAVQNPELIPKFFASQNMSRAEAVDLARNTIIRLGYKVETLYADLEPEIYTPAKVGTNEIPHYLIKWLSPNRDITSARFEVNGAKKLVESIWLLNLNLVRDPPVIPGEEDRGKRGLSELPASVSAPLMRDALPLITEFAELLNLGIRLPLDSNSVANTSFYDSSGGAIGKIALTNGYVFTVQTNKVLGFSAPDEFFVETHEVKVRDFIGKWNLSEAQVIQQARVAARKIGVPDGATAGTPRIDRPFGAARTLVPRCALYWQPVKPGLPSVRVEMDAESGEIKALMVL